MLIVYVLYNLLFLLLCKMESKFFQNEEKMKKENEYDRETMIKNFRREEVLENRKIEAVCFYYMIINL